MRWQARRGIRDFYSIICWLLGDGFRFQVSGVWISDAVGLGRNGQSNRKRNYIES